MRWWCAAQRHFDKGIRPASLAAQDKNRKGRSKNEHTRRRNRGSRPLSSRFPRQLAQIATTCFREKCRSSARDAALKWEEMAFVRANKTADRAKETKIRGGIYTRAPPQL